MLEKFFISKTRIKLLSVFLSNPDRDFYVRELGRLTGYTLPSISKEIRNLNEAEFITLERRGKHIYCKVNKNHLIYPELKSILQKTEEIKEIPK